MYTFFGLRSTEDPPGWDLGRWFSVPKSQILSCRQDIRVDDAEALSISLSLSWYCASGNERNSWRECLPHQRWKEVISPACWGSWGRRILVVCCLASLTGLVSFRSAKDLFQSRGTIFLRVPRGYFLPSHTWTHLPWTHMQLNTHAHIFCMCVHICMIHICTCVWMQIHAYCVEVKSNLWCLSLPSTLFKARSVFVALLCTCES